MNLNNQVFFNNGGNSHHSTLYKDPQNVSCNIPMPVHRTESLNVSTATTVLPTKQLFLYIYIVHPSKQSSITVRRALLNLTH